VGPAVSYRDGRTLGIMEEIFARIPAEEILPAHRDPVLTFNTLYQLAATARRTRSGWKRARHVFMLPKLLPLPPCGALGRTSTRTRPTTQMYNIETND